MVTPRLKTGIREFDEMLRGGFMQGDAVMLAGSAGTGKTTLGLQYLVNGIAMEGQSGIYLTFEQMPDQIYRDAINFGWDLRKLEDEGKFRVICTSPDVLVESFESGEMILDSPIKEIRAQRIVVDSLSHFEMFVGHTELRKEAYRMINYFKIKGVSSVLLWELPQLVGGQLSITDVGLSFLVDSIVLLKFVEIQSCMKGAIGILKMRGSSHDKTLREYKIGSKGIEIHDSFSGYEGILSGAPTKAASEKFEDLFRKAAGKK